VLTVAEIGVSTTGLEFFYAEAPPEFKTATAALFLLTTAVGDLMGGLMYSFAGLIGETDEEVLMVCGVLMVGAAILFVREARRYEYRGEELKDEDGGVELSENNGLMHVIEEEDDEEEGLDEENGGGNAYDMREVNVNV